jgi:hydrogenase maturation protease
MEKMLMPEDVELLDGGTAGADLLDCISDRQKVIVVDAVDFDIAPGSILRLTPEDLVTGGNRGISLHDVGLAETLAMTRQLKCQPKEVVIIGVKPKDISCGLGLSDEIADVIPRVIEAVLAEIISPATISAMRFQVHIL